MRGKHIGMLEGFTLSSAINQDNDEIVFKTTDGRTFKLYHERDCCESVQVEDIIGDLEDLVGSPILYAEEVDGETDADTGETEYGDHYSWTFYKIGTVKGGVTIRWFGQSNGYYSESVDFAEVGKENG